MKKVRGSILAILTVLLADVFTVAPLFRSGFTNYFSSIEPVYFAMARFFGEQFPNLSWAPEWYLGFPLRYLPNPLFVGVLALANSVLPLISISFTYRVICGLDYVFLPVIFFFFVYFITRKHSIATISALCFIFLPSLVYIFPGIGDLAGRFSYPPFTLLSLVYFGSGPRVLGLGLELVGLVFLLRSLSSLGYLRVFYLGTAVAALVFLTDPVAAASFLILGSIFLLSEMMVDRPFVKLERWFWLIAAALGLSAFWFNPSYLWHLFFSPSLGGAPFKDIFLTLFNISIIAVPLFLGFFATKFGRKKENQTWVIVSLWLGIFGFLFGIYYLENWEFASEYVKFIPEIDLGVCLLIGVVGEKILRGLPLDRLEISLRSRGLAVLGSLGILGLGFFRGSQFREWLAPRDSLTGRPAFAEASAGRPEYEIAKLLDENVMEGERVYVTGSTAFWLNALSDVFQVRGGSDMSAVHPWWAHASYQIREGSEGNLAVNWLKSLGVSYIVVHDDSSAEFYHDYKFPEKFEDHLEKVYDNYRGDRIYKVSEEPLMVRVVSDEMVGLQTPKDGADSSTVGEYANWRMSGSPASLEWLSNREAVIKADLEENQALSLAMAYDSGWRGKMDGTQISLSEDPIGNIIADSDSSGEVEIRLVYSDPFGVKIGYLIMLATITILAAFPKYGYILDKFKPRFFDFSLSDEQEDY